MNEEKFSVISYSIGAILGLIKARDIAIPEIQRPFVWRKTQVRDLLDSLYRGYPSGYLITWKNPNVRLKDGTYSSGKKILIDGQQRVTALMTSLLGSTIINQDYKQEIIKIAFNPIAAMSNDNETEIFEVQDQSHLKGKKWIPDVSVVFKDGFKILPFIKQYCADNPDVNDDALAEVVSELQQIANRNIGVIELTNNLEIDVVTEIFIRINSKGTVLSQGDFVMSKIAADEINGGNMLRKAIDYFSHLSVAPEFFPTIALDNEFSESKFFEKIKWLKNSKEDVYNPECDDIIRVAFMLMYDRARLADLVGLLSGRNFETKEFNEEIIADTFSKLTSGVSAVINENHFNGFMLTIRGAGFISSRMVNSRMAIDFAYTLYLRLKQRNMNPSAISHIIQRWYVLSVLTGRYTGSPESVFYHDLKEIKEIGIEKTLQNLEDAIISDNLWTNVVPQNLGYASSINPTYLIYLAAQVTSNDISLLSNNLPVRDLIEIAGDIHHIFPKDYLRKHGIERNMYNQVANYAYLDSQVNKSIGNEAPKVYFTKAFEQCTTRQAVRGSIIDPEMLNRNLLANCIPQNIRHLGIEEYQEFLTERRQLMANKIRDYYYSL